MIKIRTYADFMASLVAGIDGLETYHLVAEDNHAVNRLKDKRGVQLVAVIPNAAGSGDVGMPSSVNTGYIFVLERRAADATDNKELEQYEKTQNILLEIRGRIEENAESGCGLFYGLQAGSIQIEPEYNVFGGWNGWSMLWTFGPG